MNLGSTKRAALAPCQVVPSRIGSSLLFVAAACSGCTIEASLGDPASKSSIQKSTAGLRCPEVLDLGTVPLFEAKEQTVVCPIYGTSALLLRRLHWSGGDETAFQLLRENGSIFRAPYVVQDSLRITIKLNTERPGQIEESLELELEQGLTTQLHLRAKVEDARRCILSVTPNTVPFGAVEPTSAAESWVRFTNRGQRTCHLASVTSNNALFSSELDVPQTIEPGAILDAKLRFAPDGRKGFEEGTFEVASAEGAVLTKFLVSGSGVAGTLTLAHNPIEFGARMVGCTHPSMRWVQATPSSPMELLIALTPDSSSAFSLESASASAASPQSPAQWRVQFEPQHMGLHFGRLRLAGSQIEDHYVELIGYGNDALRRFESLSPPDFQLSADPMPASIEIWIGGGFRPSTIRGVPQWSFDHPTRTIRFETPPAVGERVEVYYDQVCKPESCGNGVLELYEQCDDGNGIDTDACRSSCIFNECGDGYLWVGQEECEDGNRVAGDSCNQFCQHEVCGNGVLEPPEACDPEQGLSDLLPDACRTGCRLAHCGDGIVDSEETCDDGNEDANDSCLFCQPARCGDGYVFDGVEECDDGNQSNWDACDTSCRLSSYKVSFESKVPILPPPSGARLVDLTGPLKLPFTFKFLGVQTRSVDATQPGILVFDGSTPSPNNTSIPSQVGPSGFWAWWWDELDQPPQALSWTIGPVGSRAFVLRIDGAGVPGTDLRLNADLYLFEGTGGLAVHYRQVQGVHTFSHGSATAGWESSDGLRGGPGLNCSPSCSVSDWPAGQFHLYTP